ncbi:hypothetical protein N9734_00535 [Alphaproteobacteria bacterium]|nr:hypothetical protein [Alphaproteobacteria bacterium]MDC1073436.1 hypothetical protein [Gammaproteobacteria bacterium]
MVDWIHQKKQGALDANIAEWMLKVMDMSGWSANKWAEKSGVAATTITRFLKDNKFSLSDISKNRLAASFPELPLVIDYTNRELVAFPGAKLTTREPNPLEVFLGLDWDGSVTEGRAEAERQGKNPYEISEQKLSEMGKHAQLAREAKFKEAERARKSAEWIEKQKPNYKPNNIDDDIPF